MCTVACFGSYYNGLYPESASQNVAVIFGILGNIFYTLNTTNLWGIAVISQSSSSLSCFLSGHILIKKFNWKLTGKKKQTLENTFEITNCIN